MSRDLVVVARTPVLGTGGGVRTYGVIRALATLGPVDVLYAEWGADAPAQAYRDAANVALHKVRPTRGLRRALAYGRARAGGVPDAFARAVFPELIRSATALAGSRDRGRVVADGPQAAAALFGLARRRPVVYNAHNVESSFRHDVDAGRLGSRRRLEAFERRLLDRAGESWMVSRRDMELAAALAPGRPLRHVPNVVDAASIVPVVPDREAGTVLFVADFSYQPNRDGLRFLVDEVMPRLWPRLPGARLRVAGRGLQGPPSDDERVEALGFVKDLREAYRGASCVAVPLLEGGGSPLKFVEALAYGLPVVATSVAAAGLDVRDGEHYRHADGPEAFASALLGVLSDGDDGLGARGRALAEREYSVEALAVRLRGPRQPPDAVGD